MHRRHRQWDQSTYQHCSQGNIGETQTAPCSNHSHQSTGERHQTNMALTLTLFQVTTITYVVLRSNDAGFIPQHPQGYSSYTVKNQAQDKTYSLYFTQNSTQQHIISKLVSLCLQSTCVTSVNEMPSIKSYLTSF